MDKRSSTTTPQPPPLKRRGGRQRDPEAPSSSEEGVGGGGPTRKVLLERAAAMRKNPTEPEKRLWMALRDSRFRDVKFRRQATIGKRIVDLFCPAKALVVEIDGHTHDPEEDAQRDLKMEREFGFITLRFTNVDVMTNLDGVLIRLGEAIETQSDRWAGRSTATTPQPPLKRRGSEARDTQASPPAMSGIVVAHALREAASRLEVTSDTPRLDAELLMAHALGASRSDLLLRHMGDLVPQGFAPLLERRLAREPVAYILGHQEFYGLELRVTPAVLIPRGDSETLVDAALAATPDARRVLDCGTGSGALLLAVLAHLPEASGVGTDRSPGALAVASGNAAALGLADRAQMLSADWSQPDWQDVLGGPFDLILANPPYVEDAADIAPSIRDHEPAGALFAGAEGLDDYRILVPQLPGLLAPGGVAMVEIGHAQAEAVKAIAASGGLTAALHRDLGGRPRALEMRRAE